MGSCLAYGLTATGGLCTCYYWFVAHKYLLLVSLTDYGDACSNVGYGTFRNAAILRTEDEYLNIVGTLSVGKCLASTVGKYQESIDLLSQLFEMSADGVCAFLVIHNATLWHQKYQEINATIIAAVTESRNNQSLTELYASVCETGVADTLVRGSYYLLRTKINQILLTQDALNILSILLPCKDPAVRNLLAIMGQQSSAKEVVMAVQEEVEKVAEQAKDEDDEGHDSETAAEKTSWGERLLELVDLYHAGSFFLLSFAVFLFWDDYSNPKTEVQEETSVRHVAAAFIRLGTCNGCDFIQSEGSGSKNSHDLGRKNDQ